MNKETHLELIKLAEGHQAADEYVKGSYFESGKGCAVGFTIEDINQLQGLGINHSDHEELAGFLGIPIFLTKMQDDIFEGCSDEVRKSWPVDFMKAIDINADYSLVMPKFLLFVLKDIECEQVKDVLRNWVKTGAVDKEAANAANAAAYAARAAAAYAARAAAYADARSAYAAANAASYAASYVANADSCDKYAIELLRLMRGGKDV